MFKLLTISFAICAIYVVGSAANAAAVNFVVPEESLSLVSAGKSLKQQQQGIAIEQSARPLILSNTRNTLSDEENSVETGEDNAPQPSAGQVPAQAQQSAYRRVSQLSESSSGSGSRLSSSSSGRYASVSTTGAIRSPSLIIDTSNAGSSNNVPTIHHQILPAETIPLPITFSTRSGLRTVIAPETITIQQPTVARIGEVVQHIPTAVSHQRQTVVHNHARVITPIVAPAVRTITSQVLRAYHTPLVYAQPQIYSRVTSGKN